MAGRRILGIVLLVAGLVALAWGGLFWTRTHTVVDAGPLEVQTQEHEGFALPPVVGIVAVVAGVLLLVIPVRRRV